jgi:hypothetical protein
MAHPGRRYARRAALSLAMLISFTAFRASAAGDDRDNAILSSLAVQTAMQQAREYLLHHNAKAAVEVLEGQLPRIDGNQNYLVLLKNAYRAYIRELRLANQEALAQTYTRRLSILDPSSAAEAKATPVVRRPAAPPATPEEPRPIPTAILAQINPQGKPPQQRVIARGYSDDDPFRPANKQAPSTRDLLERAEQEFGKRKYREAGALYARAHELNPQITAQDRERWAYCKLHGVVEQLNRAPAAAAITELEAEVRKAQALAPRLGYAQQLLAELDKRRVEQPRPADRSNPPADPPVAVQHSGPNPDGWYLAESTNFRIFYRDNRDFATQAVQIAEQTRRAMQRKWFGAVGPNWQPRCDIFLYLSGDEYSRATGAPTEAPGHSTFNTDGGRVLSRRIDLNCENPNLLRAVLPHETTHVVLAGNFGDHHVPRWADEGMAVLTEPPDKIEPHLRNLSQHRENRELFSLHQLVHMSDYPEPRYIGAFYAESVALVDFLVRERGPQVFTQFVRDGLNGGYEASLQKHYGYRDFNELERRWAQQVFGGLVHAKP